MRFPLVAALLLIGCGGDDTTGVVADAAPTADTLATDAASDAPAAAFTLTSSMLVEGQPFDVANTCDGANTSPPLVWTNAPAGTMSFAIILTDKTNGLIHSVIYDIPSTLTGLPANVEKVYAPANVSGAHQTLAYNGTTRGYLGPCPPPADGPHTYEFALYAINAAILPGSMMSTTRTQASAAILANNVGKTTLTGTADR